MSTEVSIYQDQMATYARQQRGDMRLDNAMRQKIKFTGAGVMYQPAGDGDLQLIGPAVPLIVVAYTRVHAYYNTPYNPDSPSSPTCYAFGPSAASMAPHPDMQNHPAHFTPQASSCADCRWNKSGSAGIASSPMRKACRNHYRAVALPAGHFDAANAYVPLSPDVILASTPVDLQIPPTSIQSFRGVVDRVTGQRARPLFMSVVRVSSTYDAKTQFKVGFNELLDLPDEAFPALLGLSQSLQPTIERPFQPPKPPEPPTNTNYR